MKPREELVLIDGNSLLNRAFYALPLLTGKDGQYTNAVYGFANMLVRLITEYSPAYIAVAFDVKGGTFRNDLLPQYKGTREAAPEELLSQLPLIQQMLKALGVTYIEKPGYEGDDVIGTLATMGERAGYRTLVLSGDRNTLIEPGKNAPPRMETARLRVSLRCTDKNWKLYPLSLSGERRKPLPVTQRNGSLEFRLDTAALPDGTTPFFELIQE